MLLENRRLVGCVQTVYINYVFHSSYFARVSGQGIRRNGDAHVLLITTLVSDALSTA
jgi:hypothetical protein